MNGDAAAFAACAEITRTQARNFYYGLRLLPEPKRSALYVVYAWMRVADDIADAEGVAVDARRASLDAFERETRAALADGGGAGASDAGRSGEFAVVLDGLARVARRFPLVEAEFLGAIEGQRMDLAPREHADFAEVERYCDRVASTVGRICLDIWGVRDGADAELARELSTKRGVAFQLTNILRDIREDHARGRCYLPADELAANGIAVGDLLAWRQRSELDANCERFMHIQCARAQRIFAESAALDALVAPDAVATIRAMSAIYRGILRKIAREPRRALVERARLTPLEKSWIALRARLGLLGATE